jgi:prepilin-type N-terminal cleavage/methylation domain-containing protein
MILNSLWKMQKSQQGFTLIEVLISIVLLGALSAAFLSAVVTSISSLAFVDRRDTAKQLAKSQIEFTKGLPYSSLNKINVPAGYQIDIQYSAIPNRTDGNVQKICVTVFFQGNTIYKLEDFEVK